MTRAERRRARSRAYLFATLGCTISLNYPGLTSTLAGSSTWSAMSTLFWSKPSHVCTQWWTVYESAPCGAYAYFCASSRAHTAFASAVAWYCAPSSDGSSRYSTHLLTKLSLAPGSQSG